MKKILLSIMAFLFVGAYASENPFEVEKNVKMIVEDQGFGFKEKNTNKIFERFYSNRPEKFGEHSGLGLNIVRNLVEVHGGSIIASNRLSEKGAKVDINFPELLVN